MLSTYLISVLKLVNWVWLLKHQGHRNNLIFKSDGTFTSTTALNLHDDLYDKI